MNGHEIRFCFLSIFRVGVGSMHSDCLKGCDHDGAQPNVMSHSVAINARVRGDAQQHAFTLRSYSSGHPRL